MHRTHTCGELGIEHLNFQVTLAARVDNVRKFGGLTFLTLRDRYGITQISCDPAIVGEEIALIAAQCHNEDVIKVTGTVKARPESMTNQDMIT